MSTYRFAISYTDLAEMQCGRTTHNAKTNNELHKNLAVKVIIYIMVQTKFCI